MASGPSYGLINAATQYHNLKIIQNTVRVPASLYTMDLGALYVYQNASKAPYQVNWNQMSDRVVRHYQTNSSTSQGSFYHGSSTRHTQPGMRPGSTTPGGYGVDIKHNSYHRYLSRIKGKGPVRRGPIPPGFGNPIPFTCAAPIYGGKTMKTSIVSRCNCPTECDGSSGLGSGSLVCSQDEYKLYKTFINPMMFVPNYTFCVGQQVWAKETHTSDYSEAFITAINEDGTYELVFSDESSGTSPYTSAELLIYYPCNCSDGSFDNEFSNNSNYVYVNGQLVYDCLILNEFTGANALYNFFQIIAPLLNINLGLFNWNG
jgi:hypothetical protein